MNKLPDLSIFSVFFPLPDFFIDLCVDLVRLAVIYLKIIFTEYNEIVG